MNIENMQIKGQLAEARKKFKEFDTEASGLIILIRSLLNPYEEDICRLEIEKATTATTRLNSLVTQMKILKSKIEKLEAHFD
ncbi:MAG: hypothetical protein PHC34_02755 [Candidatus Gastranaerophilales bacterium]|nr:hypothetical protein [Candidatus Gastranaerophilales bacterium]